MAKQEEQEIIRVLLLEDSPNDTELVKLALQSEIRLRLIFKVVIDKPGYLAALEDFKPDIILSDYSLPQFDGFSALKIAVERDPLLPFIIVTGSLTEEMAAESIRLGSWDYVVKERLHRLPRAFENAIRLKREKLNTRRAEAELKLIRDQESMQLKMLWDAIHQAPNSITITDVRGIIQFVNPHFEHETGYTASEAIGQQADRLMGSFRDSDKIEAIWGRIGQGKNWVGEIRSYRKDGSTYWIDLSISPITDHQGKVQYVVSISNDITARKEAELNLMEAKEKAELSDRLKTSFLNTISHEVRTPLNGILGFASLLSETDLRADERQSYVDLMNNSAERLLQTIDNIMEMSIISSGNLEYKPREFMPSTIMANLFEKHRPAGRAKNLEMNYDWPLDIREIRLDTDPELLDRLIDHLMQNAVKFTNKGSVTLSARLEHDALELSVTDTGIGIAPEALPIIFERFSQEDYSMSRIYDGSGLGLAIVKGLADRMGGEVTAESEKGRGSRFSFWLAVNQLPTA